MTAQAPETLRRKTTPLRYGAFASTLLAPYVVRADYYSIICNDHPVGYWRLRETSGTVARDASPTKNDGTYLGTYPESPLPALDSPGALVADRDGAADQTVRVCTSQMVAQGQCPTAQDGKVWHFDDYKGLVPVKFQLIPSLFSPSPQQLWVPAGTN